MKMVSTNGRSPALSFSEAIFRSMAADGGLFMPAELVPFEDAFWRSLRGLPVSEIGVRVMQRLLGDEIGLDVIEKVVSEALNFPIPLVRLEDDVSILELFHGPTLAFKDVGARFMARMMSALKGSNDDELLVLVATSGDTGSAVAQAFLGVEGTRIVVLFPDGQVSALQERQFSTLGDNVSALAVDGTFDDCQRLAKQAFADTRLCSEVRLTSANSINIGRLLPQMLYYISAWAELPEGDADLVFCTPSGNFGNLTAGLIAHRLGLPAASFIASTNINDVFPEYIESGVFQARASLRTISNAMDVGDPSNLARINHLYNNDVEGIRADVCASRHDDEATRRAIHDVFKRTGRVLDPHSAVGYLGLRRELDRRGGNAQGVLMATAHPAKFRETVSEVIGEDVTLPERLSACLERERRVQAIAGDYEELRTFLLGPETT